MKYGILGTLFLMNNEYISYIALLLMFVCFFADIVKAREAKR